MESTQSCACGKTFPAQDHRIPAKTSAKSCSSSAGSATPMLMYLDLRNGSGTDASWELVRGQLPGQNWMPLTGCRSGGRESTLASILQADAPQKYYLSAKAAQGIMNRAAKRGKILPQMLKEALEEVVSLSIKSVRGGIRRQGNPVG